MTCRRDRSILTFLAFAALSLGGCGQDKAGQPPLEAARDELAQGDPLDAQVLLQRALDDGTPREELAALFGEAALAAGDRTEARRWLAAGEFSEATRARGFRLLGRLEMAEGRLPAAGRAFDRALRAGPAEAGLWVDIGRLRYRGGEQLQAIAAAERALEIDPEDPEALRFRGQLARDAQGLEAGAQLFARALANQPRNAALRTEFAATLGDAGRAREALAVLREGGPGAIGSTQGLFVQAVLAARGYDFLLARELLQRSGLDQAEVPAALMLSAIIDVQQENYASAAQQLDLLHRRQPDNRRVGDLLAFALSRSGAERELVHRFSEQAAGPNGTSYLRTLVGRAYEALGERDRAARFLDLAAGARTTLATLPSQVPSEAIRLSTGGDGMETRDYVRDAIAGRRVPAAVRRAREFAKRFPGSGDAYAILGDAEFAKGNKRAAREAYERSAAVRRPWPLTLRLASAQSDRKNARQLLVDYVRDNPMNGEAAAVLADAFAADGQWSRSAILLDHAMGLGLRRVPWVLAARSVAALQLDDAGAALDYALAAHDLQPMNPLAIAALLAALPETETAARLELEAKLRSLTNS